MLTIVCPHCGCHLKVSEKAIGSDAECVQCHKIFTAAPPPQPTVYPTERADPVRPLKEFRFSRWLWIPIFLLALLGLLRIAGWVSRTHQTEKQPRPSLHDLVTEREDIDRELSKVTARIKEMQAEFQATGTNGDKNLKYMYEVANFYDLSHMSEILRSQIIDREEEASAKRRVREQGTH